MFGGTTEGIQQCKHHSIGSAVARGMVRRKLASQVCHWRCCRVDLEESLHSFERRVRPLHQPVKWYAAIKVALACIEWGSANRV
jgi:hypothetical protein